MESILNGMRKAFSLVEKGILALFATVVMALAMIVLTLGFFCFLAYEKLTRETVDFES